MTTAVDSNILIDLIGHAAGFTDTAIAALDEARTKGAMIICLVVPAEIASYFASSQQLAETLQKMSI
ncbi:MAG: hypothetical protein FGM15_07705 [Chthoniobacterales bacterium]|nr:hypothetical protein [Chthoniobacterales bacterium]